MPERLQRSRKKGWRMPEGAVYVGRPGPWGNPYRVADYRKHYPEDSTEGLRAMAVSDFRGLLEGWWDRFVGTGEPPPWYPRDSIAQLAGHDLVCWCPLDGPCHADVLIEYANREDT